MQTPSSLSLSLSVSISLRGNYIHNLTDTHRQSNTLPQKKPTLDYTTTLHYATLYTNTNTTLYITLRATVRYTANVTKHMTNGPNYLFSRQSFMRLIDITAIIVTRAIKSGQGTRCLGLRANSPRLIVAVWRRLINITPVLRQAISGHIARTQTGPRNSAGIS